jgi:hypothetical protein
VINVAKKETDSWDDFLFSRHWNNVAVDAPHRNDVAMDEKLSFSAILDRQFYLEECPPIL